MPSTCRPFGTATLLLAARPFARPSPSRLPPRRPAMPARAHHAQGPQPQRVLRVEGCAVPHSLENAPKIVQEYQHEREARGGVGPKHGYDRPRQHRDRQPKVGAHIVQREWRRSPAGLDRRVEVRDLHRQLERVVKVGVRSTEELSQGYCDEHQCGAHPENEVRHRRNRGQHSDRPIRSQRPH